MGANLDTLVMRNGSLFERTFYRRRIKPEKSHVCDRHSLGKLKKGRESEKLFLEMATQLLYEGKLSPVFRIHRGSAVQDQRDKADFILEIPVLNRENYQIFIQIKSSCFGAEAFHRKYPESKVHIIIMDEYMYDSKLLDILQRIIRREMYFIPN